MDREKRVAKKSITYEEILAGFKELTNAQRLTEEARRKGEEERRKGEEERRKVEKERRKVEKERRKEEKALREAQKKTEKGFQKLQESQQKTEKALQELTKNLNEANGNFNNKWGKFLESLVKGDLVKILGERNIKVDMVRSRLVAYGSNGQKIGDFDLVAVNGKEIVAVEVKTTLTKEKVKKSIDQLKMLKKYFPEYRDKVLYGGVAFLCEPDDEEARGAAEYAEENGLFVILSPGGNSNVTIMSFRGRGISIPKILNPKPFRIGDIEIWFDIPQGNAQQILSQADLPANSQYLLEKEFVVLAGSKK